MRRKTKEEFKTEQVAEQHLGITYVALRLRLSRGSITRPFDTIWLSDGTKRVITRRHSDGSLIWYYVDVKRAQQELSRTT